VTFPSASLLFFPRLPPAWVAFHLFGFPASRSSGLGASYRDRPEAFAFRVPHLPGAAPFVSKGAGVDLWVSFFGCPTFSLPTGCVLLQPRGASTKSSSRIKGRTWDLCLCILPLVAQPPAAAGLCVSHCTQPHLAPAPPLVTASLSVCCLSLSSGVPASCSSGLGASYRDRPEAFEFRVPHVRPALRGERGVFDFLFPLSSRAEREICFCFWVPLHPVARRLRRAPPLPLRGGPPAAGGCACHLCFNPSFRDEVGARNIRQSVTLSGFPLSSLICHPECIRPRMGGTRRLRIDLYQ
jgi:hypothetical protein